MKAKAIEMLAVLIHIAATFIAVLAAMITHDTLTRYRTRPKPIKNYDEYSKEVELLSKQLKKNQTEKEWFHVTGMSEAGIPVHRMVKV
jgi:hypothetical protein